MNKEKKLFRLDIKIDSKNVELINEPQTDESGNQWVELRYTPTKEEFKKYTGCWLALITEKYYRCIKPVDRVEAD
jgi:hypothetical protein